MCRNITNYLLCPHPAKKGPAFYPALVKQLTRPVSAITGRAFVSCTGTAQAALLPLYPKEAFGTLKHVLQITPGAKAYKAYAFAFQRTGIDQLIGTS